LGLTLAALTGCTSAPRNVLIPVAATNAGAEQVEMIVATTRSPSATPGELFSGERGPELAFAEITVSIPPEGAHVTGEVEWPGSLPPDPATDFAALEARQVSQDEAVAWFHETVGRAPDRSVLIFVHGFNNRFEDAVFRFAQITHDSGAKAVPILFTWPSRGSMLAYGYDRESTNYSRDALEAVLQALERDPAVGEVSILAHSMGNWLTLEALRQMAIRDGRIAPKIRNVMMAAPDVDVDVFREMIARMGEPRPSFTLFVSQDDRALAVSRRVWRSTARLGAIDPEVEPYRTEFEENAITAIDLTAIRTEDSTHHAKFAESPEIVQLIGTRLATGQTITDSHIGLGDRIVAATAGVGASVGAAAGLVLSAPVAVVDQTSRQNYANQAAGLDDFLPDSSAPPRPGDCAANQRAARDRPECRN
jgi:esterase/lipase superfamily enzyme